MNDNEFITLKNYKVNKTLLSKAIKFLLQLLLRSVKVNKSNWSGRLNIVIEVKNNKIINKFSNLVISTNNVLETDTIIISKDRLNKENSHAFRAMIRKTKN